MDEANLTFYTRRTENSWRGVTFANKRISASSVGPVGLSRAGPPGSQSHPAAGATPSCPPGVAVRASAGTASDECAAASYCASSRLSGKCTRSRSTARRPGRSTMARTRRVRGDRSRHRRRVCHGCRPIRRERITTSALPRRSCDRVAPEAVHPALALFEVDRVRGQVPVHDRVAPPVEVDALLPDAGRREHERPERAVERVADLGRTPLSASSARRPRSAMRSARSTGSLEVASAARASYRGGPQSERLDGAIGDLAQRSDRSRCPRAQAGVGSRYSSRTA